VTAEGIDRMKNTPSLWMLAAGAFALIAMVAYLFFALTLADHMQPDPIPAGKAAATQSPM
jgi:type VI protein secretion system component VasF